MNETNPNESSGLTLTELILSVAMVGGIVLAIVAIDVSARRFLLSTAYESKTQNEASPVLEYIVKDVTKAIGTISDPGIVVDPPPPAGESKWIRLRHLNTCPVLDEFSDYSDDNWVEYRYDPDEHTIYRNSEVDPDCLAAVSSSVKFGQNITGCQFSFSNPSNPAQVAITITARKDSGSEVSPNNPEVVLQTKAFSREQTLK